MEIVLNDVRSGCIRQGRTSIGPNDPAEHFTDLQPRFWTNIVLATESALALHRSWPRRHHSMEALCCEGKPHQALHLCHPTVGFQTFQKFQWCKEALVEYKKSYQHATPAGDAVETQQNAEFATACSVTERDTAQLLLISVNGCSEDRRRK